MQHLSGIEPVTLKRRNYLFQIWHSTNRAIEQHEMSSNQLSAFFWITWCGILCSHNTLDHQLSEKLKLSVFPSNSKNIEGPLCTALIAPTVLYESIGHLWGRCLAPFINLNHKLLQQGTGTTDHLTLLRLYCLLFRLGCHFTSGRVRPPSIASLWLHQTTDQQHSEKTREMLCGNYPRYVTPKNALRNIWVRLILS